MTRADGGSVETAFASRAYITLYNIKPGICPRLVRLTTTREVADRLDSPLFMGAYMECGGKRSATPLWVGNHAGRWI